MYSDIHNSILKKLYDVYFESFVSGFRGKGLEDEFSSHNPNEIRIILNKLVDDCMISNENDMYKILNSGIQYLEETKLVRGATHQEQRNEILLSLKKGYECDTNKYISHETVVKELNISGPKEILSEMNYLCDEGYLDLSLAIGGTFEAKLTNAGYELVNNS